MTKSKTKSNKYSVYFCETPARDYSFLGFYQYRRQEPDFTFEYKKEALKLKKDLDELMKVDSEEVKAAANNLLQKFKASIYIIFFFHQTWLCD